MERNEAIQHLKQGRNLEYCGDPIKYFLNDLWVMLKSGAAITVTFRELRSIKLAEPKL